MTPFALTSERLRLDPPAASDAARIVEYCQDPLFERFLATPWPYQPADAAGFIESFVPDGWASGTEYTWAVRSGAGAPLIGVIGLRREAPGVANLGFWIGAPHRGRGYMTEAVRLVSAWAFRDGGVETLKWECYLSNAASAAVARKVGFRYVGTGPADLADRDGRHPEAWHGVLTAELQAHPPAAVEDWPV
ncbi:GNAT family N-acetyltransferase [Salinibacterium sp. ZJ454]|uniref:GNAT family N-acetyltransferase n=1 Tax=Salinibacterium sp. ZJ454 TaxID=2708339 RepID=UPI00141E4C82|nr:GNAT family N-acetyltransferase [Salinibacterium sp. ZJ454]